jgi:hypothetical protein
VRYEIRTGAPLSAAGLGSEAEDAYERVLVERIRRIDLGADDAIRDELGELAVDRLEPRCTPSQRESCTVTLFGCHSNGHAWGER